MNDLVATVSAGGPRAEALQSLHYALQDLWQYGGNALVAWIPRRDSIEVLTVPKIRLFSTRALPRRVFAGDRLMGRQTFTEVADALGIQPIELRLALPVGGGDDALSAEAVEEVFANFAVTKADHRAVILIDIVSFSKFSPEEQASQLATLDFALNIAVEAAREKGIGMDISRSTTGDGFYAWNSEKGTEADLNLFVMLAMFMTYYSSLRRRVTVPAAVPAIRTAVSIGSHYAYHQPRRDLKRSDEYIVGDVTISVARLIGMTRADQIIIGEFHRPDDATGEMLSTDAFVRRVSDRLAALDDVRVMGSRLNKFSVYLTGPRQADGSYRPQKLRITDKHGLEHFGYNGKINVFLDAGEAFYCGLQHADLLGRPKEE